MIAEQNAITDELLRHLTPVVQRNCHIADSRHAGDYTLCVYLLKMREYFRWEKGIPLSGKLDNDEIGNWLTGREAEWESLEEEEYAPLVIDGNPLDPFEARRVNELINPYGLVYSAGLGNCARPHFFLGELVKSETHAETTIYVSGMEYARDLTAPPAMSQQRTIFLRQQSLRRMIWEKVEEWRWKRQESAMGRAIAEYDFDEDTERALDAMTDRQVETLLLHEIGEVQAGERLGEDWHELIASLPRSQAEFMVRAVRDLLADCLSTLPALLERQHSGSIHFYFSGHKGMRQKLFPGLEKAYQDWVDSGDWDTLHHSVELGRQHWSKTADTILDIYGRNRDEPQPLLEKYLQSSIL
jgi:hypothetical protein